MSHGGGSPPRNDCRAATGPSRARSAGTTRGAAAPGAAPAAGAPASRTSCVPTTAAGAGMLTGALAYFAFFTMVPALLLFVSLLGVLVEDRDLRDQLVEQPGRPPRSHPRGGDRRHRRPRGQRPHRHRHRRARPALGCQRLLRGAAGRHGAHVPRPGSPRLRADTHPGPADRRAHPGQHAGRRACSSSACPSCSSGWRPAASTSTAWTCRSLRQACAIDLGPVSALGAIRRDHGRRHAGGTHRLRRSSRRTVRHRARRCCRPCWRASPSACSRPCSAGWRRCWSASG